MYYTHDEAVMAFGDKLPTREQFEELKGFCAYSNGWSPINQYSKAHRGTLSTAYPPDNTFQKIATYVRKHKWRLIVSMY